MVSFRLNLSPSGKELDIKTKKNIQTSVLQYIENFLIVNLETNLICLFIILNKIYIYIDLNKNSEFIWGVKWFIKYQIYDFCWYKNMCKIFILVFFTGKLYVFAAWILTRKNKHLLDEKICFLWNNEWKAWILILFNLHNFY